MSASDRTDIYDRITADIVSAIENGAGDWRMPWHHDGSSIARPKNVTSDKGYRGINVLALWVAARRCSYMSGIWGTYQQWTQAGCQVRKGEKATTVVFWKQMRKGDPDDRESDRADGSDSDERKGPAMGDARGAVDERPEVAQVVVDAAPAVSKKGNPVSSDDQSRSCPATVSGEQAMSGKELARCRTLRLGPFPAPPHQNCS